MNYLDEIASQIIDAVPQSIIPSGDTTKLFRLYAVLLLAKMEKVDSRDVHNAWVAWKSEIEPSHDSLVPFDELDRSVADEDQPFVSALHQVAQKMRP